MRRGWGLGGLALGALLGLVAAGQPWWRARAADLTVDFTGVQASGGLSQALPLAGLAGALLVLALRRRGRQVAAALVAALGLGMVLLGALGRPPNEEAVRTEVRQSSLADQFALSATAWPWVYAVAGLVLLAAAVLVAVTAPSWPARPDRFRRADAVPAAVAADDDPSQVWRAFDAGLDPTAPDVTRAGSPDTMGSTEETRNERRSAE